jgi:hypothetical protein
MDKGLKLYEVDVYECGRDGIEGWNAESVWATDKEAAYRQVHGYWRPYFESNVRLKDREDAKAK